MKILLSILLFVLLLYPFLKIKKDRTKYYQLPIIFSITTFALIIPSLFSQMFSDLILSDTEYYLYIINVILCLFASYMGYSHNPKIKLVENKYSYPKILIITIPFFLVSFYISFFLIKAEEFGNVLGGLFAILIFFARMIRPVGIILFFIHLIKPRFITFCLLLVWVIVPLRFIIISGRRSEFFMLFITLLLPLFFIKKYIPNKKLLVLGGIVGFLAYFVLPTIREYTKKGEFDALSEINIFKGVQEYSDGEMTNDIYEAAINMNLVYESFGYQYGGQYFNKFVNQFVSSTIFGDNIKEAFKIDGFDFESARRIKSGNKGDYLNYLAPSGYVDSFYDFGFLAFIPFYFFARISKKIWIQAYYSKNLYSQIFYSYFVVLMFMAIYDSLSFLPVLIIHALMVFLPIKHLAKS
jgi:hypothetical protein